MATVIRLTRIGRKNEAIYRMVVADNRSPRDGKFLAQIGFYNPNLNPPKLDVEVDAAMDWLEKGAIPSDTAKSLLKHAGVMGKFHAKKAGQDVSNYELKPIPFAAVKPSLSIKAKAKQAAAAAG